MDEPTHFCRKRPVQRRARQTLDNILDALAQILSEIPLEDLTTNHVADRAGYSIGTIYDYFEDKHAMVRAFALRELRRCEQLLNAVIDANAGSGVPVVVRAVVRTAIEPFADQPTIRQQIAIANALDPILQKELRQAGQRVTDRLLTALKFDPADFAFERNFILMGSVLWQVHHAARQSPHLLQAPLFEEELVMGTVTILEKSYRKSK